MSVGESGWSELLQGAEQLKADMDVSGLGSQELPRVERNLHQILEAGQQLWARTQQGSQQDVKASILLGSKGYDLPRLSQKLESLSTAKTFEPIKPVRDLDIKGFLRNERENAILSVIEETKKKTYEALEKNFLESTHSEWEQEKQRILHELMGDSQEPPNISFHTQPPVPDQVLQGYADLSSFPGSPSLLDTSRPANLNNTSAFMPQSTMMSPMPCRVQPSALNNEDLSYGAVVEEYNNEIIRGGARTNLVDRFAEAAKKFKNQDVDTMWSILKYMTDVPVLSSSSLHDYRMSSSFRSALVHKATTYLQDSFKKHMEFMVSNNMMGAELGGVPGTIPLVRSYLNVKVKPTQGLQDGLVMGQPVWAMIYCCLRCGDLNSALTILENAGPAGDDARGAIEELLVSSDHSVGPNAENQIQVAYRRFVRTSTDPYKRVVYCVLGACDVTDDHSEICNTTDDWLWVKLFQLRDGNSSKFDLAKLQTMLVDDYGEGHFDAYRNPWVYSSVLLLTGQFEVAIEFLSRLNVLRCHAVHAALALYELQLLLLPASMMSPLLTRDVLSNDPTQWLNLMRLILLYTKKFEDVNPKEALQYFYFLRRIPDKTDNMFITLASELALQTREFDLLLGTVASDGSRVPGFLDKFKMDTSKVVNKVAEDSEEKGLFEDAVLLYDLAGDHDKVLSLLNQLMSQLLSGGGRDQHTKSRVFNRAIDIAERIKAHGHNADSNNTNSFYLLLDLATFFHQYQQGQFSEALDTLEQLKLVPQSPNQIDGRISVFQSLSPEVKTVFPEVLLCAMSTLHEHYKNAKNTISSPAIKDSSLLNSSLRELKERAGCLVKFAGAIPCRMPGDTVTRLVQKEALMS